MKRTTEERVELSESRKKVIERLYELVYRFADELLNEEDAFEEQRKKEPDKKIKASAYDYNIEVMKDCIRETRDTVEFLKNGENYVEEWQIVGINAMLDQCNKEGFIPYDLLIAIKGVLCMDI